MAAKFLDESGVRTVVTELLSQMDSKDSARIVTTLSSASEDTKVASAKAVYDHVVSALSGVSGISFSVVTALPSTGASNIIYLLDITPGDTSDALYEEWVYVNNAWVNIGTSSINLSAYYLKADLVALNNSEVQGIIADALA
jgi:hypothetical protein